MVALSSGASGFAGGALDGLGLECFPLEGLALKRLALTGQTPQAALAPTEAALQTLMPAHAGAAPVSLDAGGGGDADDYFGQFGHG